MSEINTNFGNSTNLMNNLIMDNKNTKQANRELDSEILYSKTVKAGKRIYYIDVKRDRKGEYYLSVTESKRLKDQADGTHFVFEKHKIFLYREDLDKFQSAFNDAVDFTVSRANDNLDGNSWKEEDSVGDDSSASNQNFKLDIEF